MQRSKSCITFASYQYDGLSGVRISNCPYKEKMMKRIMMKCFCVRVLVGRSVHVTGFQVYMQRSNCDATNQK